MSPASNPFWNGDEVGRGRRGDGRGIRGGVAGDIACTNGVLIGRRGRGRGIGVARLGRSRGADDGAVASDVVAGDAAGVARGAPAEADGVRAERRGGDGPRDRRCGRIDRPGADGGRRVRARCGRCAHGERMAPVCQAAVGDRARARQRCPPSSEQVNVAGSTVEWKLNVAGSRSTGSRVRCRQSCPRRCSRTSTSARRTSARARRSAPR